MIINRKKLVTVAYENIERDPRASKFRDVLKETFDVITICTSYKENIQNGREQTVLVKKGRNYLNWFLFVFVVLLRIKRIKPSIILSHNYDTAFPCWLASKLFRIPLAYDAYEFYTPQKGVAFSKRDYFFFFIEKFVIKRANLVFSANMERSRLMKSGFKLSSLPIPVLNIPSYSLFSKKPINGITNSEIKVVYEGFVSFTRFVNLLIDSFEFLPSSFHLVIIGDGPDVNLMKDLIASKTYKERIDYRGSIDSKEVIPSLSKCDIGFVGYPFVNLNNRFCSPNKIYEYPAAGIPFVSTNQMTIYSITKDYHICDFYNPLQEGAEGIANAIMNVADNYWWYSENLNEFINDNNWANEGKKILDAFNSSFK